MQCSQHHSLCTTGSAASKFPAPLKNSKNGLNNICFPNLSVPNGSSKPLAILPTVGTPQRLLWLQGALNISSLCQPLPRRKLCNPHMMVPLVICAVCTNHNTLSLAPLLPALSILIQSSHLWECCCHLDSLLSI